MRTVVVGNRQLARQLLRHMLDTGWEVNGVLVPEGQLAARQANFVPVDELVADEECQLHKTADINSNETLTWLTSMDPDLCLCGGWSQVIDEAVLDVPDRGFLGFHSSRLPKGRGGAPVNWALINGTEEVWISFFYYEPAVDAGDVIAQGSVMVEPRDDVETVFDALTVEACRLLSSVRSALETGTVEAEPQRRSEVTYRPRRQPQDGLIDWERDPSAQYDWIRAQTDPYPGAYTFFAGESLTVWRGEPIEQKSEDDADPGEVLAIRDGTGVDVRTGGGMFRLIRVQHGERPSRWADEFARDIGLSTGDMFGREHAPDEWLYTGIRGPETPTSFETNLATDESGTIDLVAFAGSEHDVTVAVTLDGETVHEETERATRAFRTRCKYSRSVPGEYTLRIEFDTDGESVDTRFLKVYVHE